MGLVLAGVAWTTGLPFSAVCSSPPPPAFDFEATDEGDGTVSLAIVYTGGPELDAGRLRVLTDDRNVTWAALDPDSEAGTEIRAGDRITLQGLDTGTTVRVGTVLRDADTSDLDECRDARSRFDAFGAYEVGDGEVPARFGRA